VIPGPGSTGEKPRAEWHDEQHSYVAGQLLGLLLKQGIEAMPVMDETGYNYTPCIDVEIPIGDEKKVLVRVYVTPGHVLVLP
jgi:hypothetical protein